MANALTLSQSTIEKLGYYVYLLIDPRTEPKETFYVGKGKGNRINHHLFGALAGSSKETEKVRRIREIQNAGYEVGHVILRHGLTEDEAFAVECAMIDYIGVESLTNLVKGHYSNDQGKMTLEEVKLKYEAEEAQFDDSVLLIDLHSSFKLGMTESELYAVAHGNWVVNLRRVSKVHAVCAVYRGIIREVYVLRGWNDSGETDKKGRKRYRFDGDVAPDNVRDKYIHKSVKKYWKQGIQNPIKYVG